MERSAGVCPLRTQCVAAAPGTGRTVQLHPQEALLQQARALQQSEAFGECRQRRVVVEHRLARLVQLGIRQSRYFGRAKTKFQLYLAATVANLTLGAAKAGRPTPAAYSGADAQGAGTMARHLAAGPRLDSFGYGASFGTGSSHHWTMGRRLWRARACRLDFRAVPPPPSTPTAAPRRGRGGGGGRNYLPWLVSNSPTGIGRWFISLSRGVLASS